MEKAAWSLPFTASDPRGRQVAPWSQGTQLRAALEASITQAPGGSGTPPVRAEGRWGWRDLRGFLQGAVGWGA